jgi:hypothetical protein
LGECGDELVREVGGRQSMTNPRSVKRGSLASLSPEARAELNAIIAGKSVRHAATLLGASDNTIAVLREPYGTASPRTVERLTKAIESFTLRRASSASG